jgi:hypothetical protein
VARCTRGQRNQYYATSEFAASRRVRVVAG